MKKKLNIIIITIGFLLLGVMLFGSIGASSFFLPDTLSSTCSFEAGTLDLKVNKKANRFESKENSTYVTVFNIWELKNIGTIDGYVDISNLYIYRNNENKLLDGHKYTIDGISDITKFIDSCFYVDINNNTHFGENDIIIYKGLFNRIPSEFDLDLPLGSGGSKTTILETRFKDEVNLNQEQFKNIGFDINFILKQRP